MKIVILVAVLAVVKSYEDVSKPLLSTRRHSAVHKRSFKSCSVRVVPYPLSGKNIRVDNSISHEARSSYNNFSLQFVQGKVAPSELTIAVEYEDPGLVTNERRVQVKWNNLLITASLSILEKDHKCDTTKYTLLGFVELVQTDTAWYKDGHSVNERREKNLAANDSLQYVLTKLIPHSRHIFANDTSWGKVFVEPRSSGYTVPLKYESSESIVIDYNEYPNTVEYERLIKKKIFLVETSRNSEVLKVIAGVDVTMYIDCIYDITAVTTDGHITINKSHSLIQRIANPEKYSNIIKESSRNVRDKEISCKRLFQNPGVHTLNPFIHIHTTQ